MLIKLHSSESFDCFIDVGVNVGQTLLKVKSVNEKIYYIGFEPNPVCVQYVNKLIKINQFIYTSVIPVALFEKTKLLKFYAVTEEASDATLIEDLRSDHHYLPSNFIPAFNFDDISTLLQIEEKKVIIKIDVEGSELEVIQGMYNYLQATKVNILCELLMADNSTKSELVHSRCIALQELLSELGYEIYQIRKCENFKHFQSVIKVDCFNEGIWDPQSSPAFCDYIFIHRLNSTVLLNS